MNLLRSKEATLAVLIIALTAQIPHAAYVFTHIGKQLETWFSFVHGSAYAVALELAVLLFVVRNRKVESYGFAFVSVLINLSYYNMHGVSPFQLQAFPAWLVSVALPVAIACYSHDIAHDVQSTKQPSEKRVTRTVRNTQTVEQSEQFTIPTVQPEQYTVVQPEIVTAQQVDYKQLDNAEKRERMIVLYQTEKNQSQLADMFGVSRGTVRAWLGLNKTTVQESVQ